MNRYLTPKMDFLRFLLNPSRAHNYWINKTSNPDCTSEALREEAMRMMNWGYRYRDLGLQFSYWASLIVLPPLFSLILTRWMK